MVIDTIDDHLLRLVFLSCNQLVLAWDLSLSPEINNLPLDWVGMNEVKSATKKWAANVFNQYAHCWILLEYSQGHRKDYLCQV